MKPTNQQIARKLREHACELARSGQNLYRVRAFRSAALAVMGLTSEVTELVERGGARELERVPGIGKSLAETIASYAQQHAARQVNTRAQLQKQTLKLG